ncbi:spore germination protein (amino acid permease) [Thermosyntropha lipolytica DSM 11003]|uniref:Spore germination protein (Amino acid permease) n=1 Tax=Thermosyntropha lipolytica DSM 11003 TaxID=1123382 RepID=A0A1M5JRH3_9FIRM|nr:endospore germination permease [Thermosyntropha lipolytica]SHG43192.1 spore germination protein (amino acid permease) [Thermosyntropha lipolytica DSM 11003]
MAKDIINSNQFGILLLFLILGSAFIFVPEGIAGRDCWAASLIASLTGLYIISLTVNLQNRFPGLSIIEISTQVLGKPLGLALSLIYSWVVFLVGTLYMYDMLVLMVIIFPGLAETLLVILLIAASSYVLYRGINSLARLGEILLWIIIPLVLAAITVPFFTVANLQSLTPILASFKPVLAGVVFGSNWPYGEISLMAMLLPFVADLSKNKKTIYIWFFIGVIILVIRSLLVVAALGQELMGIVRFPLYEVLLLIRFSTFQRIELFFFIMWSITNFMAIILSHQSFVLCLKSLFSLKDYKTVIIPAGLCIAIFTLVMFPSDIEFMSVESFAAPFHNLPVHVLYPTLVWLAARFKAQSLSPGLSPGKQA